MIDQERAEKALDYLASTDEKLARIVGRIEAIDAEIKAAVAIQYLNASGTVGDRQASADSSDEVMELREERANLIADRETLRLRRATATAHFEMFRTLSSNRRAGQVV